MPAHKKTIDQKHIRDNSTLIGNGCWEWNKAIDTNGYGVQQLSRKKKNAHRVSYGLFNGPIPTGMFVLHRCDNRKCVNPSHLFLGTQSDNMADMVSKGRGKTLRGESHNNAKITESIAREIIIKSTLREISQRKIADMFGVSQALVSSILNGKRWAHLRENYADMPR